jgi:hypothetical protein
VIGQFKKSISPLPEKGHPEVRKRASVFRSPLAPGFGVNGQSAREGSKDLVLESLIERPDYSN